LQEKDTIGCPDGYDIITTVPACISAAQWLDDHGKGLDSHGGSMLRPSDTNGDGDTVDLHDTPAMMKWMALREIQPGKNLGNQKPYGCYSDQSIRIIKGQQKYITTLWVNLNEAGSGKHDNSAPICQTKCPQPVATTITTTTKPPTTTIVATTTADPCQGVTLFKLMDKDTTPDQCPTGYDVINDVEDCVKGAQYLDTENPSEVKRVFGTAGIKPSDTNGDGVAIDLHNTNEMLAWIRKREIPDNAALGNRKPFGCYADQSIRIVNGEQKLISTLWVNHNKAESGKHDNSAPICMSTCGGQTALFDASHKEVGEQFVKDKGHEAETPVSPALINGVAFVMLATAIAFAARQFRLRHRATRTFKTVVQDEPTASIHDPENPADDSRQYSSRSEQPLLGAGIDEQSTGGALD